MRHEFSKKTKDKLAGRAGYQCSHPECNIITIGPGHGFEEISSIGEAAHIYSAALNGPRGQGLLLDDDLKSIANGFWACKNHARLIDTNDGSGFSAEQLKSWKLLHEEKIKKHQGRLSRNIAWINSITIKTNPLYEENSKIFLGKVTYLYGPKNCCGRTTLLNWISCLSNYENLGGWIKQSEEIEFTIDFYAPFHNSLKIHIKDKTIASYFNNEDCLFNPIPVIAHRVSCDTKLGDNELDDEQHLCMLLNIDKVKLQELIKRLGSSSYSRIETAYIKYVMPPVYHNEEEDGYIPIGHFLHIKFKDVNHDTPMMLNSLSSSEKFCVIFEITLEKIKVASQHIPCLLLLDLQNESQIEAINSHYISYLMSSEVNFQTVIASLTLWKFHTLDSSTTYELEWDYPEKTKITPQAKTGTIASNP